MGKVKGRSPREWLMTLEVDRCRRQSPTMFSTPTPYPKPALRTEWMHGNSGPGGPSRSTRTLKARKDRITLAKVWND
jgi:hypothetical protein